MAIILKAENLTKMYDDFKAIDGISFEIDEGEIVGLVGPNGAGKTTIIHMLLLLLEPTDGRIEIFGRDIGVGREDILKQLNFAAPYSSLPYNLTIEENLKVFSLLYGLPDPEKRIAALLEEFDLVRFRKSRAGSLSSGEQTRLSLAKAFINDPKLLLLDEPTAFLDPAVSRDTRESIRRKISAFRGAALWTSHNMAEIEAISNRIIFLFHGKILAFDTPARLRQKFQKHNLEEIFLSLAKK